MTAQPRYTHPVVPPGLEGLVEMALDLRWSWSHSVDEVWERLDPELWEITHNPWHILQTVAQTRLETFAADREFLQLVQHHVDERRKSLEAVPWFAKVYGSGADMSRGDGRHSATVPNLIAYFSMEFGLSEALPIYSGGLGILAGDYLKTASDLGVPMVGVGLLWQQGYFRQALNADGQQIEFFPFNDPGQLPLMPLRNGHGEWVTVALSFPRRTVRLRVWEVTAGRVKLYLLDANNPVNSPADRGLTAELYGGGIELRLQQEMILGIAGWRLLHELGLDPDICHLNEGHAAFAVLERARAFMESRGVDFDLALTATRPGNLFTTHTPVEAGFDRFPAALLSEYLGEYAAGLGISLERLLALGRLPRWDPSAAHIVQDHDEPFNMAYLAIRGSGAVNGVSRLHGEVSRSLFQRLFPRRPTEEVPVGHVTNGVHVPSWDSPEADALWTRHCGKGRWLGGVGDLGDKIRSISDEELWAFRDKNRRKLIQMARDHVKRQGPVAGSLDSLGVDVSCLCDPATLTLGFARRFTSYKRVNLLLHDPQRLERILCAPESRVQLVLSGKAHPADTAGKAMIRQWTEFIRRCCVRPHILYLVDYDMGIAEHLVQGVDVWINTPRRPWEASGTSGMKVLVTGGLNLSELDGWWAEAYSPEVGWALGDGQEHDHDPAWDAAEAEALYNLIENVIIPEFYDRDEHGIPRRWIARVRESMAQLAPRFSSNRMLDDYLKQYYLPLTATYRARVGMTSPASEGDGKTERAFAGADTPAGRVEAWRRALIEHWSELRFVDFRASVREEGSDLRSYALEVELELGGVPEEGIRVELYADAAPGMGAGSAEVHLFAPLTGLNEVDGDRRIYALSLSSNRPLADFTPRVVPWHPDALLPLEAEQILWYR